jgi:hypothetical protein
MQCLPELVNIFDDVKSELTVLGLSVKSKLIFRLAIRDLVDTVPLNSCLQQPRAQPLYVLNV